MNSMSLLPSTSAKLSIFHVITVVKRAPAEPARRLPEVGHDRLPGLVPREAARRHVAGRRADVGAEGEQMIEAAEERRRTSRRRRRARAA